MLSVAVLLVAALVGVLVVTLTSRGPQTDAAARAELVAAIGLDGCQDTPGAPVGSDGLIAAVDCAPGATGASAVTYRRYADTAALERAYRAGVAAVAPVGAQPCGTAPDRAQGPYDLHGTVLGTVLCDNSGGVPTQTWTVDALRLLGTATGPDAVELNTWRSAHVLERPWINGIVTTVNAAAAPAFPTPAESALLAGVPAASNALCTRPDQEFVEGNVGDPAGVTAVACGPVSGAATVFWFGFDSAARFDAFPGAGPGNAADCQTNPPGFSGSAPYAGNSGSTGVLGCATTDDGVVLVWTDQDSRRVGVATGADPAALLEWWRTVA